MRPGVDHAPNKPPLPPIDYALRHEAGLVIERNVAIPLRDGVRIYADVYRPGRSARRSRPAALLSWSPYGKHAQSNQVFWRDLGVIRNGFRR
jgi:predicted acyl esterase